VRLFNRLYRFLENKYFEKSASSKTGWTIHFSRKLDFWLLLNLDHYIDYLIYRYDVFEPKIIKIIQRYLQQEKVVAFVDVGSNIGQMSLYVAKHYPAVLVVSYEAVPQTHAQQAACMLINNLSYELHNLAVTNGVGEVTLYQPKLDPAADLGKLNPGMASMYLDQNRQEQGAVQVRGVALANELDRLGLQKAEGYVLIKIDVEGAELAVLEGLKPSFSKGPGLIILVELLFAHHYESCHQAAELLLDNGFCMYDLEYRPIRKVKEVDKAQTDFIFLKCPAA
jgi:FkbM family methyltransferase